ncbi:TfuA-like protein [Streptomyces mauvecolor]
MLVVYAGPSLRATDVERLTSDALERGLDLELRPPIIRGDLEKLTRELPTSAEVLLLDGEFGQNMSVSVTEVRAFLQTGRRMSGASSMGALRATECRVLGMAGYGWVTQQYLDGVTDSDADVALLFEPETYQPVTIPLVNVRWLLDQSLRTGLLTPAHALLALEVARSVHYRLRLPSALERAWSRELPGDAATVLLPFLDEDRLDEWDRKRTDALEALDHCLGLRQLSPATPTAGRFPARFPVDAQLPPHEAGR